MGGPGWEPALLQEMPIPSTSPRSRAGLVLVLSLTLLVGLAACAGKKKPELTREQATVDYSLLLTLPDETTVYPGHGPDTTIGVERNINPFLQDGAVF